MAKAFTQCNSSFIVFILDTTQIGHALALKYPVISKRCPQWTSWTKWHLHSCHCSRTLDTAARKLLAFTVVTVPQGLSENGEPGMRSLRQFAYPQLPPVLFPKKVASGCSLPHSPTSHSQKQAVPLTKSQQWCLIPGRGNLQDAKQRPMKHVNF